MYLNVFTVLYLIEPVKQNSLLTFFIGTVFKICNKIVVGSMHLHRRKAESLTL